MDNIKGGIAIYHVMRRREDFEETAGILWVLVRSAAQQHPGAPRLLYLDIDGHSRQGKADEWDDEAMDVIHFVRNVLGPHVSRTPWGRADESAPQDDNMPDRVLIPVPGSDDMFTILTGDKDRPVERSRIAR